MKITKQEGNLQLKYAEDVYDCVTPKALNALKKLKNLLLFYLILLVRQHYSLFNK